MLDVAPLRSFIAVVQTGSVAEAARRTGYSRAAVSRHVANVESWAGLGLFHRTGRSLRPSVAARVLADQAALLLEEAAQFESAARRLSSGRAGRVRLGYFRAAGTTIVPQALAVLARRRPEAEVSLVERALSEDVMEMLATGELDAGFVWGWPDVGAEGVDLVPLFDEALVLLTSIDRDDLHDDPRDLSRLVGEPFVSAAEHKGAPPIVDRMFVSQGLPAPTIAHRSHDHAMTRSLVAAGMAVALLPALGVSDPSPGVRRSIVQEGFRRTWFARPQGASDPLGGAVRQAVITASAEYSGFGVSPVRANP